MSFEDFTAPTSRPTFGSADSSWVSLWRLAPVAAAAILASRCGAGSQPGSPTPTPTPAPTPQPKPNIVFLLADDDDSVSIASMPHVQELLVRQGMSFRNAFACFPLCAPARASMLTALHAHNHGIGYNATATADFRASGRESSTVAVKLQQAGYRTALIGKYVNQYEGDYVPQGWDVWASVFSDVGSNAYYNYWIRENNQVVSYGDAPSDYLTDVLAQRSLAFVRQSMQQRQPFLLWLAPSAPHVPAVSAARHASEFPSAIAPRTASFNEPDVSDKPEYVRNMPLLGPSDIDDTDALYRDRLRAMLAVDEALASLVDAVTQAGQLDNTWFIFTSDNGFMMGQHRFGRGKDAPYEASLLVPLVVRGPNVPANVTRDHMVTLVDLGATLFALAGPLPTDNSIDGRSLLPLLGASPPATTDWRSEVLIEHLMQTPGPTAVPDYTGLRTATEVYVEYKTGEAEYYNLAKDPDEMVNTPLAASVASSWASRLAAVRNCRGSACP
jgi:N-acetylglucosamine-6-sulfatase